MNLVEELRAGADDPMWVGHCEMPKKIAAAAADEIERLRTELAAFSVSFNLRWEADMRAIARWQAAHPGNDLTWPDHADMVVWLLEQLPHG